MIFFELKYFEKKRLKWRWRGEDINYLLRIISLI